MQRLILGLAALALWNASFSQACSFAFRMNAGPVGWGGAVIEVCVMQSDGGQSCSSFTITSAGTEEHLFQGNPGEIVVVSCSASGGNLAPGAFSIYHVDGGAIYQWSGGIVMVGGITAFTIDSACNLPPQLPWDCVSSAIYSTVTDVTVPPNASGQVDDFGAGTQGCLGPEVSGFWISFHSFYQPKFTLQLSVIQGDSGAELDFAIWGPFFTNGCADLGEPIRCSSAATGWPTGMMDQAFDEAEDADGDGWLRPICAYYNEWYWAYISVNASQPTTVQVNAQTTGSIADCLTLSSEDAQGAHAFIRPQPANDRLHLSRPAGREGAAIIAMDGSIVQRIAGGASTVDVSGLPMGAYVLRSGAGNARLLIAR